MLEGGARADLDVDDLFEPKSDIGGKRKAYLIDADPVAEPDGNLDSGFGSSKSQRSTLEDSAGRVIYTSVCTVLGRPFVADGPQLFWELIQFFGRLPWRAVSSTPALSRWCRNPYASTRVDQLEREFGVDHDVHFIPSRKMVAARNKEITDEDLVRCYDIEVQASIAWIQVFSWRSLQPDAMKFDKRHYSYFGVLLVWLISVSLCSSILAMSCQSVPLLGAMVIAFTWLVSYVMFASDLETHGYTLVGV